MLSVESNGSIARRREVKVNRNHFNSVYRSVNLWFHTLSAVGQILFRLFGL